MGRCKLTSKVRRRYRNRVRECRLKAMISKQKMLSRQTGIPRSTISALETNKLFLSSAYALLIRDELKCSLDDLYEEVEPSSGHDGKPPRQKG